MTAGSPGRRAGGGAGDGDDGAGDDGVGVAPVDHRRRAVAATTAAVVVVAASIAVYRQRHTVGTTLSHLGGWAVAVSVAAGLVGVGATGPMWVEVVRGLGVGIGRGDALRVFFKTQLGKYVPGAVWPIVLQAEAGRAHGANRRTMVTAGVLNLVISIATGLLVACALLPFSGSGALTHYWPVLVAVPPLLVLMHPRALPGALDLALRATRRPSLGDRLDGAHELRAVAWSLVSWAGLGTQLFVLCGATGHRGLSTWLLCVGAVALAVPLGILFIPAPAGAGVREAAITLVLGVELTAGQALAVAVASRALLILCDLLLAAVAAGVRRPGAAPAPDAGSRNARRRG